MYIEKGVHFVHLDLQRIGEEADMAARLFFNCL